MNELNHILSKFDRFIFTESDVSVYNNASDSCARVYAVVCTNVRDIIGVIKDAIS